MSRRTWEEVVVPKGHRREHRTQIQDSLVPLLTYFVIIFPNLLSVSCKWQQWFSVSPFCLKINTSVILLFKCKLFSDWLLLHNLAGLNIGLGSSGTVVFLLLTPQNTNMLMPTLWTEMSPFWFSFRLSVKFDRVSGHIIRLIHILAVWKFFAIFEKAHIYCHGF